MRFVFYKRSNRFFVEKQNVIKSKLENRHVFAFKSKFNWDFNETWGFTKLRFIIFLIAFTYILHVKYFYFHVRWIFVFILFVMHYIYKKK